MPGRNSTSFIIIILALGMVFGLIISSGLDFTGPSEGSQRAYNQYTSQVSLGSKEPVSEKLLSLQNTSEAFIEVANQVIPTVVSIQSSRMVRSADLERFHDREDLKEFFKFNIPKEYKQRGSGSGIIVSEDGFILTNVHVVDKAQRLKITLFDNREFDAQIVGLDRLTEVAVVKVESSGLPVAKLGNSSDIKVGQWVLAVGNPLELRSTVTAGIVSAKERQIDILTDQFSVESFLQTDAAINPGNSGGALVNLHGEVIGVNTAIATETGYNAGFGFAIPINLARKVMKDLIEKGKVERGYLGIAMQNIDEKKARALGLDRPKGVFVNQVMRGHPAEEAGIKSKDIILTIDKKQVSKSNQVQAIIAQRNPGETVKIDVLRDSEVLSFSVILGKKEFTDPGYSSYVDTKEFTNLGLSVEEISVETATELDYTGMLGVIVTDVERWSPAFEAGIRENDVIVEVDDHNLKSKDDFIGAIDSLEKGTVSIFTINRRNETYHFFVEIPQ